MRRATVLGLSGLGVYLALMLVPKVFPAVAGSGLFFLYVMSLPLVLLGLAAGAVWAGVRILQASREGRAAAPRHRTLLALAPFAWAGFVLVVVLSRSLPAPLPSGSDLRPFDAVTWRAPRADELGDAAVSPRQAMLGDVVRNVLPGRTRPEIVALLGPADETSHFSGRHPDLIYALGPQRDVPIRLDFEWLLLWFDTSGRLERHAVLGD